MDSPFLQLPQLRQGERPKNVYYTYKSADNQPATLVFEVWANTKSEARAAVKRKFGLQQKDRLPEWFSLEFERKV